MVWKNWRALILDLRMRPSSTISWYFSVTEISEKGTP